MTIKYKKMSFPSTPSALMWGVEGKTTIVQSALKNLEIENKPVRARVWHCLILKKQTRREWIVKVSDGGLIDPERGWICDCGNWTFGNDKDHTPVFSRVGRIVRGRAKNDV